MKNLTVFDRTSPTPKLDPELETLDEAVAARVAAYLSSGTVLVRSTQRVPDAVTGRTEAVVPISTRTDGEYVWSDATAYYIRVYHVSPGREFVEHCEKQHFTQPMLSDADIEAAMSHVKRR